MISDRTISTTFAASALLWTVGLGFMLLGLLDLRFMGAGLWLSGLGGVLSIRRMFCGHEGRMRNAFELGRDHERGSVRLLR